VIAAGCVPASGDASGGDAHPPDVAARRRALRLADEAVMLLHQVAREAGLPDAEQAVLRCAADQVDAIAARARRRLHEGCP